MRLQIQTFAVVFFAGALIALSAPTSSAQGPSSTAANNAGAASSSGSANSSNAEIVRELEQMRARIEQLEAQLKAQSVASGGSAMSADPIAPQVASAQPPAGPLATPVSTASADSAGKPAKRPAASEEPFAFADWTWLNGNPRTKEPAFDSKFFTPEIRTDVDYVYDFVHPKDNTIGGSSEVFRSNEVQVTQLGVGGDFHYENVRARLMTQFG